MLNVKANTLWEKNEWGCYIEIDSIELIAVVALFKTAKRLHKSHSAIYILNL